MKHCLKVIYVGRCQEIWGSQINVEPLRNSYLFITSLTAISLRCFFIDGHMNSKSGRVEVKQDRLFSETEIGVRILDNHVYVVVDCLLEIERL